MANTMQPFQLNQHHLPSLIPTHRGPAPFSAAPAPSRLLPEPAGAPSTALTPTQAELLHRDPVDGMYTCPICKQRTEDKHCLHYGGVSCYSCRAFFRRAHQSTKDPNFRCKKGGRCEVTVKTRRKCQKCRYELCLKAGMDPELVLSSEQKNVRFRNYLKKKKQKDVGKESKKKSKGATSGNSSSSGGSQNNDEDDDDENQFEDDPEEQEQEGSQEASFPSFTLNRLPQPAAETPMIDSFEPAPMAPKRETAMDYSADPGPAKFLISTLREETDEVNRIRALARIFAEREEEGNTAAASASPDMLLSQPRPEWAQSPPSPSPSFSRKARQVELVLDSFSASMSAVNVGAKLIETMQRFHSDFWEGEKAAEKVKNQERNKGLFAEHIFRIANQFKQFAMMQPAFRQLSVSDQMHQLSQNTALFIQYIISRYITAPTGEEQLQWILDVNMPQNLSTSPSQRAPRRVDLLHFNEHLGIFKTSDNLSLPLTYHATCQRVYACGLCPRATGLLANLILFHQGSATTSGSTVQNAMKVQATFYEGLELLKYSQEKAGKEIHVETILELLTHLGTLSDLFNQGVDWSPAFQVARPNLPYLNLSLPYTEEEEGWLNRKLMSFRRAFGQVSVTDEHISEWLSFSKDGKALTKKFILSGVNVFLERIRRVANAYSEFKDLPVSSQNALWSRNRLACLALCIMRMDLCRNGLEQIRYGMGNYHGEEWIRDLKRAGFQGIDPRRLPYVGMADYNRSSGILSPAELVGFFKMLKLVSSVVRDDASFELVMLLLLFSGDTDPNSSISQVHRNFSTLLERRFSSQQQRQEQQAEPTGEAAAVASQGNVVPTAFPSESALPAEAKEELQRFPRLELRAGSCMRVTQEIGKVAFFVQRMEQL